MLWGRGILSLLPRRGGAGLRLWLRLRFRLRRLPTIRCLLIAVGGLLRLRRLLLLSRLLLLRRLHLGGLLALLLGRLGDLRLGLADGDALGVHRLGVLGGHDHLLLDAPAPLGHTGALADLVAQVVELRPPDVAAGGHLELLDLRRVQRERSLDADAEGLLAHSEGLARAAALALDHDPLEDLGSAAVPLDDLEVHAHAIAGGEPRPLLQRSLLEVFDDCAHEVMMVGTPPDRRLNDVGVETQKMRAAPGPRAGREMLAETRHSTRWRLARGASPGRERGRPRAGSREPPSRDRRRGGCSAGIPAPRRGRRCRTPRPRSPRRRGRRDACGAPRRRSPSPAAPRRRARSGRSRSSSSARCSTTRSSNPS